MTTRIAHRGPDADGALLIASKRGALWKPGDSGDPGEDADIALGHRRLSIIDLSERGRQPMTTGDGGNWIVFNGEIYNYLELRAELLALGHAFATETDTEVILAAYREWGHGALSRFNGMFAFALWDGARRELFCARDRLGVKPLFYWRDADHFVFGSELKALFAHPAVPRRPNPAIIYDYLALKQTDHTAETFFADIVRLPAGHYLVVRPDGEVVQKRWWEVATNDRFDVSPEESTRLTERFREVLFDAVRLRLRSDVPIGTCLSGGLDSSMITMIINELITREHGVDHRMVGDHQKTFSACFDDPRFDERDFIKLVLEKTNAESHLLFPDGDGLWRDLDRVLWHMDEPFHSTSQYSQYCVMRKVAETGVNVTLDGQGADELLAGYPGYYGVWLGTLIARRRFALAAKEARAAQGMGGRGRSAAQLLLRVAYGLTPIGRMVRGVLSSRLPGLLPEGRLSAVLRPDVAKTYAARRDAMLTEQAERMRDLPRRLHHDVFHASLPALLRYEDRNSMAHSIEARTPFLDYRVVEASFEMPMSHRIHEGWTKRVLRDAGEGLLPPEIQWRKDKKGFVTPESIWLRQGRDHVREVMSGSLVSADFLDGASLKRELDRSLDANPDGAFYTDVFRWFMLEKWMRSAFA
ncbi:asparagine synthase (glutamine-hydrolyzing) [soil metagenome]